ncbi:unnamed protein product [Nippostrongylus brasiliensis]|uniref:Structural maintenance of chromosomes protein 5 n=1 Tax=Nippostrongylus brasiliensis TaxID=27835 RepID=A0A0N4XKF8_NIPBR|nr:unnamed protein product [Nippostrongylus brasiliensis]
MKRIRLKPEIVALDKRIIGRENFVKTVLIVKTYDNVVCRPGPNLNVFIGTNGAGKSTVICGICLAVGGNPKVLGRSERMGDYIKHKRDEGYVELYIADSRKGEQSVKILLERPNSCTYFINGSRSTQKAIDNPCTFLAQDKVKSFSEQSPVDLLMNTERAGDIMLMEKHEELIKKKKQESVHIENARVVQLRLQSIEGEISALLPRAENYKKKEFMRTKIRILQKKKAVMEFNECEDRFSIEEAAMDRLQSAVKETDKQIEQLRKKNEKKANQKEECTEKHNDAVRNIHRITDEINTLKDRDLYEDKVSF